MIIIIFLIILFVTYQILKIYNLLQYKMSDVKNKIFNIIENGLAVTFGLLLFVLIAWLFMKYGFNNNQSLIDDDDNEFNSDETIDDINNMFDDV